MTNIYPKHPIPRYFMIKRHRYVREILKNSKVLDIGSNKYKILTNALSLDINPDVKPDIVGNGLKLPFTDCSFDSITALELIEHFRDKEQNIFLNEINRVLKHRGQFIISTPNISEYTKRIHDFLWYVSHWVYAREDLGKHIGELTHKQLKLKLIEHNFKIMSEKAFSLFNYVVDCEKI